MTPRRAGRDREPDGAGQDGNALLGAAVGLLTAVVLAAVAVHVGALVVGRARVSTAADHAALAAAAMLADDAGGTRPGVAARLVAAAMDARLVSCACETVPVAVTVEVVVDTPLGHLPHVPAIVRATGHAGLVTAP